jgi:hypothetical protein
VSASASRLSFCSITDARYLAQVIVMHRSLREVLPGAENEVLCMDLRAMQALEEIGIPGLVPVAIEELEQRDPALLAVRPERSSHEYAQTAKPAFCLDMLARRADADWITYVDADSMFFAHPGPVFEELDGSSIGLLGHRFAARFRSRQRWASPYCPSWVSFATDSRGSEVAGWWRSRCLEWCFHRVEGDRHSDQGYLRDWPQRFAGVHVLEHPGLGPAPWTDNDGLGRSDRMVTIDGRPLILFHYQSLRVHRPRRRLDTAQPLAGAPVPLAWRVHRGYRISGTERELVWDPYLGRLAEAMGELRAIDPGLVDQLRAPNMGEMTGAAKRYAWMRKHDFAAALSRFARRPENGGAAAPE